MTTNLQTRPAPAGRSETEPPDPLRLACPRCKKVQVRRFGIGTPAHQVIGCEECSRATSRENWLTAEPCSACEAGTALYCDDCDGTGFRLAAPGVPWLALSQLRVAVGDARFHPRRLRSVDGEQVGLGHIIGTWCEFYPLNQATYDGSLEAPVRLVYPAAQVVRIECIPAARCAERFCGGLGVGAPGARLCPLCAVKAEARDDLTEGGQP